MDAPFVFCWVCELGDEEVDAGFDLLSGAHELRIAVFLALRDSSRVGHAPVRGHRRARELGADLLDLVEDGDDAVQARACAAAGVLGGSSRHLTPSLCHPPAAVACELRQLA